MTWSNVVNVNQVDLLQAFLLHLAALLAETSTPAVWHLPARDTLRQRQLVTISATLRPA